MTQTGRSEHSVWTRLEHAVATHGSVTWFNDHVLHHSAIGRGRAVTTRTWTHVLDVCYPMIVLGRGTRRGSCRGRRRRGGAGGGRKDRVHGDDDRVRRQ